MNIPLLRQIFVVSSSLLAAASTGSILGFPSILVQQLRRKDSLIQIDEDTESWMASVHGFAGVTSIFIPYLMQRWGRRLGFQACCLSELIGWLMCCFAKNSVTLIVAEIFQGAGVKSLLLVRTMTISEMVEPRIRNYSIVLYAIIQTFFVLIVHTAGNFVHWKTISIIMCFPPALSTICSFFWPESPAWLAYKGRFEESKKSFIWLRGKNKESLEEMNALFSAQREFLRAEMAAKATKRSQPLMRSVWRKITSRDFYLPIFHIFVLLNTYYWSGNLMIVVYAINIISKVIKNGKVAFIGVILMDIAFIVGNISSPILLKYFGNKPIILKGGAFSILFLFGLSAVLYLQNIGTIADDSTLCLYFLVAFMVFSSTAFYMIPFGVATEIIPLRHRGVIGSIYIVIMSISFTSSLKIAPYLITYLGMHGMFLLYAVILVFCLTWIYKYVPETRNKTLQSIEENFVKSTKDPNIFSASSAPDEEMNENINLNDTNLKSITH